LDPNCAAHGLTAFGDSIRDAAMEAVTKHVQRRMAARPAPEPRAAASSEMPSFFRQIEVRQSADAELPTFIVPTQLESLLLELYKLPSGVKYDPMQYYTTGAGAKYGPIAEFAIEMFIVSAGEAPCERLFSTAGYFDSARRQFKPYTLSMLTLCKHYKPVQ